MASPNVMPADGLPRRDLSQVRSEGEVWPLARAVSWSAILAGAAAAAALSLILLILGTGLGLSSVSPWAYEGASATTIGISAIIWVTLTQILASGMGGYIAGRLRAAWDGVNIDEVYFRDSAHGFLAWAVASLLTAALLSSVIGSIIGGGVQAGAAVAGGATSAATSATAAAAVRSIAPAGTDSMSGGMGNTSYLIDSMFRRDLSVPATSASGNAGTPAPDAERSNAAMAAESTRILVSALRSGALPPEDARYVGQAVAQRTGISQPDAEKRVASTFAGMKTALADAELAAREAADKARKASAYSALWLFISLLIGAFVASLAATLGGRHRLT